jgi:type I restriction enzyme M protein
MARTNPIGAASQLTAGIRCEPTLRLTADKLRNNMDAAEFRHVVLGFIILKYISDALEKQCIKLLPGQCGYRGPNSETAFRQIEAICGRI